MGARSDRPRSHSSAITRIRVGPISAHRGSGRGVTQVLDVTRADREAVRFVGVVGDVVLIAGPRDQRVDIDRQRGQLAQPPQDLRVEGGGGVIVHEEETGVAVVVEDEVGERDLVGPLALGHALHALVEPFEHVQIELSPQVLPDEGLARRAGLEPLDHRLLAEDLSVRPLRARVVCVTEAGHTVVEDVGKRQEGHRVVQRGPHVRLAERPVVATERLEDGEIGRTQGGQDLVRRLHPPGPLVVREKTVARSSPEAGSSAATQSRSPGSCRR